MNPGTTPTNDFDPTFSSRMYQGNVGGPIGKKASYFVDFQRRDIKDNAIINATQLDMTSLKPFLFSTAYPTPNHRIEVSPRIDYQLSTNNTIVVRYSFQQQKQENSGLGQFSLPSQAYNTFNTEHRVQITETSVINSKIINENTVSVFE